MHRIAFARNEATLNGARLWPAFANAPFGMLLVEPGRETLFCYPGQASGFVPAGRDDTTGCELQSRGSTFPADLLAALDVEGVPTIVMGTPAATGRPPAAWVRTIFHEHFHQFQQSFPDYFTRAAKLDLANGSRTGMWMLNYPFPYADASVDEYFAVAAKQLSLALAADSRSIRARYAEYAKARRTLAATVSKKDWRYLEFQFWQEGTARWVEIALGLLSADAEIRAAAQSLKDSTVSQIGSLDLKQKGREVAYPYGAGEVMLLERCNPNWKQEYPRYLALGPLFDKADGANCR
jgi:hypothetical protein